MRCALDVVESFWTAHPVYRKQQPRLYHRSVASHLTNAAAAAYNEKRRSIALTCLLRSLWHDPTSMASWKWLLKNILPRPRFERRAAGGTAETACTLRSSAPIR